MIGVIDGGINETIPPANGSRKETTRTTPGNSPVSGPGSA